MPGVDFYKKRQAQEAAMARMKEKAAIKADQVNAEHSAGVLARVTEPAAAPGRPMNRHERRAAAAKKKRGGK